MISKGTTHNNGAKLAAYMTTGKEGERAELWQLRGFEATNIKDAFRDVQIMAGATKCEKPFFHVQVRNREGEKLTRQQWEHTADRIERMLGLTGQPRAIAFHTFDHNGDEHMHIAWSRIDQETLTAKPLPFFKERLKKISRELELHFGIEAVTNEREGPIKFAPTKAQEEQARRVGVDVHEIRNAIRDCWDRSDNGQSFQAALEHEGLTLAQGDRRNFVVIDHAGGIHALGKRILDVTAASIRERMSDLDSKQLPSVEQARDSLRDVSRDRQNQTSDVLDRLKQGLADVDKLLYGPSQDDLKRELKEVDNVLKENAHRHPKQRKPDEVWDRDRDDRAWQDAVINAGIENEKVERKFIDPSARETRAGERQAGAGSREKENSNIPLSPLPISTPVKNQFRDARRQATSAVASIKRTASVADAAARTIGKTLEVMSNAFESLIAPTLTPEQIRDGQRANHRREAEAESAIDFSKYTAELAHQRQHQENERERQRHRDGGGRER